MRDFGEILAENRKKKGYSQSDLVDLLLKKVFRSLQKQSPNGRPMHENQLYMFS